MEKKNIVSSTNFLFQEENNVAVLQYHNTEMKNIIKEFEDWMTENGTFGFDKLGHQLMTDTQYDLWATVKDQDDAKFFLSKLNEDIKEFVKYKYPEAKLVSSDNYTIAMFGDENETLDNIKGIKNLTKESDIKLLFENGSYIIVKHESEEYKELLNVETLKDLTVFIKNATEKRRIMMN